MTEPNPARFLELCNRLAALEQLQSWVPPEVADSLDSLNARLAAAEQRISELEGNPTPAANPAGSLEDAIVGSNAVADWLRTEVDGHG